MVIHLYYRAADDAFVIVGEDGVEVATTNATDMVARKTRDPDAAAVGILRFLDFKDWQTKTCGRVLWAGTAETAMISAPRL